MTLRYALLLPTLAFAAASAPLVAEAQFGQGGVSTGPGGMASDTSGLEVRETGVKLSDETLLHVGVTAEAGYDSNVFFSKNNAIGAPLLRVTPSIELTNAGRDGSVPSTMHFTLGASLQYREYLDDDEDVKAQRAFNPLATGSLVLSPTQSFSFSIADQFLRLEEPGYTPASPSIVRNLNVGWAQVRFSPGGRRLQATLRYTNTLDHYDSEPFNNASNLGHELMLDAAWNWLPKTALYFQVSQGYITYFSDDPEDQRQNSFPLRTLVGLRGLLTTKLAVNVGVGYAAGFYEGSTGADPSGLSNLLGLVELTYQPVLLARIVAGYRHEFRNSPIVGSFYDVDSPYLSISYLFASRITITGHSRYEYRRYQGLTVGMSEVERKDHFVVSGANIDFFVQKWFYAGVGYSLSFNDSNEGAAGTGAPGGPTVVPGESVTGVDYVKHQIFGRLGITY
jgi:hypothetical protein